ncbi:MAG: TonB family protein [Nannocystaceae bacterium]|nr:TonB family protein [Nannocystaceae bacterium]
MTTVHADARFSSFLRGQQVDPRDRGRLVTSAAAAAGALLAAMSFGWTADKLGVRTVDAPTQQYAVVFTLEIPAPPPPARAVPPAVVHGGAAEPATPDHQPRVSQPVSADNLLDDVPLEPADNASAPVTTGLGSAVPGRIGATGPLGPPRIPGPVCANPPCGLLPGARLGVRPSNPTPRAQTKRATVVRAHALFAPDPDKRRLSRTKSGILGTRGKGVSSVSFCVSTSGKVTDVKTVRRYPGDPEVDQICRQAVSRWRFNAFVVNGKARKTCTTSTFEIEFE